MNISVVIIALNEEDHIGHCVQQALKWCDEVVVVVNDESTDRTADIAREKGARVFIHPWKGYGPNKNFGNEQASNDWILSLDADEILSDEWIDKNRAFLPEKNTVYLIDLITFYFGKKLKHSGFYPLWKKRLFNKNEVRWNDAPVHEELVLQPVHQLQKLRGKVWHYSFKSREEYQKKLDNYARLGAQKWIEQGRKFSWIKKKCGPAFRFFKTYILDLGILDGRAGYEIAVMNKKANRAKLEYYRQLKMEEDFEM